MRRAQGGDHAAFEQLASTFASRLFATASLILRDSDGAKDVVQETFIDVWRNLPGLRNPELFEAWVRRILVRRCYRALRDRQWRRIEVQVDEIDSPVVSHEAAIGEWDYLERAFKRLTPDQRTVLVLHHRQGLQLAETADALGIPVGTVKSRVNRATVALRAALEAEERAMAALGRQLA